MELSEFRRDRLRLQVVELLLESFALVVRRDNVVPAELESVLCPVIAMATV